MSKAYCCRSSTVPLRTLSDWLLVPDTTQMEGLCSAYGKTVCVYGIVCDWMFGPLGLEVCGEAVIIKKGCFTLPAKVIIIVLYFLQ